MSYQIEEHIAKRLKDFFAKFDFIDKVVVFGSRAKHNANPKSDIDLCVYSLNMSSTQFSILKMEIDELPILYKLDVVHFENSDNALKENIEREGKLLYQHKFPFDKFFKNISSKPYQIAKKNYLEEGKFPVVDQGKKFIVAYSNNQEKLFLNSPVIIFGDHTRIIKYIDFDFVIGADGTKILTSYDDTIDIKYAYYQLLFTKIESLGYSRHYKLLKEKTFIKHSLKEQKAIAKKLDLAQEIIELRKSSIKKLDELSKALFIDMFGDPVENEMGWEVVELSEILRGKSANGYFGSKKDYTETGTPTIWIGDFIDKYNIDIDTLKKVNITEKKKEKYLLEYGDVLFCRSSLTKEGIAKAGFIAKNTNREVIFEDHVIKMPFDTKKILPEYFYFYSYNQFYRLWMYSMSKTATMTTIGQKEILKSPVMLPLLPLQQKFAKTIEKIEAQKALYVEELKGFEDLFESLLSESFA